MTFRGKITPGRYETATGEILVVEKVFGRGRNRQCWLAECRPGTGRRSWKVRWFRNVVVAHLDVVKELS